MQEITCPVCGARIWTDAPGGFCPSCLIRLALPQQTDPTPAEFDETMHTSKVAHSGKGRKAARQSTSSAKH